MKGRKFREKMFSTETLSQGELEEIVKGSEGYDRGEAPVPAHEVQGQRSADGDERHDPARLKHDVLFLVAHASIIS